MTVTVHDLFKAAWNGPWITSGLDVQWYVSRRDGYTLVSFQGSVSRLDWLNNLSAWVKPYRKMPKAWYAHAGFAAGYKSVRGDIMAALAGEKRIIVTGYSQGAAYATMLHEDLAFSMPEAEVDTVVFGAPRVVWMSRTVREERFKRLYRVEHAVDPSPRLPPAFLGYRHVGESWSWLTGERGLARLFPRVKYHLEAVYASTPYMSVRVVADDSARAKPGVTV